MYIVINFELIKTKSKFDSCFQLFITALGVAQKNVFRSVMFYKMSTLRVNNMKPRLYRRLLDLT